MSNGASVRVKRAAARVSESPGKGDPAESEVRESDSSHVLRAVLFMLLATVGFSASHALVRVLTRSLPPFEVAFFRSFFGLLVFVPFYLRDGIAVLHTHRLGLHFLRACLGAASLLTFYFALSRSPLGPVTAIGFMAPLFTTLLAAVYLHETVRVHRWAALGVGFVGAMLVLRPGPSGFDIGLLVMLGSTCLFGIMLFLIKMLTRTDSAVTVTAYGMLLQSPILLVPAISVWQWPSPGLLAELVALGVLNALCVLLFTMAMKATQTSLVMSLDYLRLVWTVLIGYVLFAEVPGAVSGFGMAMILAGAAYLAYREHGTRSNGES